jgi:hypothetical protein
VISSFLARHRTPGGDEPNTQFGLKVWCALPRGCGMFRAVRSSPAGVRTPERGYRARPFWTAPRRWPDPVCRFRTTASTCTHIDTPLRPVSRSRPCLPGVEYLPIATAIPRRTWHARSSASSDAHKQSHLHCHRQSRYWMRAPRSTYSGGAPTTQTIIAGPISAEASQHSLVQRSTKVDTPRWRS